MNCTGHRHTLILHMFQFKYKTNCLQEWIAIIHVNFFSSFNATFRPMEKGEKHHFYTHVTYIIIFLHIRQSCQIENVGLCYTQFSEEHLDLEKHYYF